MLSRVLVSRAGGCKSTGTFRSFVMSGTERLACLIDAQGGCDQTG